MNTIKKYIMPVLIVLLIAFGWIVFENRLMDLFDEFILHVSSLLTFSTFSTILFLIVVLSCFGYGVWRIKEHRCQMSFLTILLLLGGIIIYVKYRFILGDYISTPNVIWNLGYFDIFIILLFILIILQSIFLIYPFLAKKVIDTNFKFLTDIPIDNPDADILDYRESAAELIRDLESIDVRKSSCSVGLISPWGTGKTSYMKLLKYYLDRNTNKFIVIEFNPRHSRSAANIQKDFFEKLFSELGLSSFSSYLKAINVFAENKLISTFLGFHKQWNKNSEKEKINNAIQRIDKKIIVLIDDFDRLLAEEIIEIFKLIDGNASFKNLIFVTAYDKRLINDIIGESYPNKNTLFSDKFFTLEIQIPLRPYEKIYNFLIYNLLK